MSDDIFYKFIYLFDPPKKSQTNIFEYIDQVARKQDPITQLYIDHPTNEPFYNALHKIMEECIQQERSKVAGSSGNKEVEKLEETKVGAKDETKVGANTGANTGPNAETKAETKVGADTETMAETKVGAVAVPSAELPAGAVAGSNTTINAGPNAGSSAGAVAVPPAGPNTATFAGPTAEPKNGSNTETTALPTDEPKNGPNTGTTAVTTDEPKTDYEPSKQDIENLLKRLQENGLISLGYPEVKGSQMVNTE